jgi:hypothetical protein
LSQIHEGGCFCGAVRLTVTGEPVAAGYCHCESCRKWSAGPINAFSLWKPEQVEVTTGAEKIGTYHKTEQSYRKFCTVCGGHIMTEHPPWSLIDVYAPTIPTYKHEPQLHVHYQETVLPMNDSLPKMRDIPKEMGGSGQTMEN